MASTDTAEAQPVTAEPRPVRPAPQGPPGRAARRPLRRYPERGLLGGVCAGVAEHLGVNVLAVRLLMALVVAAGGVPILFYALAWALIPVAPESRGMARRRGAWIEAVAIVVAVAAALFGLRRAGLLIGDSFIWPLVIGTAGIALVWLPVSPAREPEGARGRFSPRRMLRLPGRSELRLFLLGLLLVTLAAASLLHSLGVLANLGKAIGAVALVVTIVGVLLAPWVVRLGRSLASERAARIREQERAELAAHLHDSVLQTLALIQKRAADPREVAGLARRQERELRNWLHERPAAGGRDSLATALGRAAAETEETHQVPIEVVTVGDRALDPGLEAMVQAAREAMANAARFAGADRVDLYAEVDGELVEVFVRDRGVGFDPATIPTDRRGVRESIIGRMERHNGRAVVNSVPGTGTEVELVMERRQP